MGGDPVGKPTEYRRLIMEEQDFIVVIDNDNDIDWRTLNYAWPADGTENLKNFNIVINRAAELENLCELLPETVLPNKRLVAEAIARALDRDLGAAFQMLDIAEATVREQLQDRRRNRFVLSAMLACLPFVMVLVRNSNAWFPNDLQGSWAAIASSFGALGALTSIAVGGSEPRCSVSASMHRPVIEGAARIVAGAVAGTVFGLAVKGGWLFPVGEGASGALKTSVLAVVAAFAAGFLERLTSALAQRFDGGSDDKTGPVPPSPGQKATTTQGGAGGSSQNRK